MMRLQQVRSVLAAAVLLGYCAAAQETTDSSSEPTFRSNVSEVRITFFATNHENDAVENVTPADFAVVDGDRVVRNFRSFSRSHETVLDIVVLLDTSESVAPGFRAAMNNVLQLVAREQSLPDDHITVVSFGGSHLSILCSSNCRSSGMTNILAVKNSGLTPLYDGLMLGADLVSEHRRAGVRPVLIVFSDGRDTISLHGAREAAEKAAASGAVIYSVDIGEAQNGAEGTTFLRWISDTTGGRYFRLRDGGATILSAVLDDMNSSYVVTYELPSRLAGFHSLRLLPTRNQDLRFHNRGGYYYEKNTH